MEEINGGRSKASPKAKKRPNPFVRFLACLVTLALVLGAVALVANRDKLNFDFIKRWFSYRSLERGESGQAQSFPFDGDSSCVFASVDGDLLVCSPNSLQLYSGSGQLYVNETISMEHPAVSAGGDTALIYDVGGEELLLYRDREELFSLTQGEGQSILSAGLNENGWLAVVHQESGYKGAVTVYDNSYETPLIQLSLSSRFVMSRSTEAVDTTFTSSARSGMAYRPRRQRALRLRIAGHVAGCVHRVAEPRPEKLHGILLLVLRHGLVLGRAVQLVQRPLDYGQAKSLVLLVIGCAGLDQLGPGPGARLVQSPCGDLVVASGEDVPVVVPDLDPEVLNRQQRHALTPPRRSPRPATRGTP